MSFPRPWSRTTCTKPTIQSDVTVGRALVRSDAVTMELEELSELASQMPGAVEEQPFGPEVDVMKVGGKIFAILSPGAVPEAISLKCEPGHALELRARYDAVIPGYHLNKRMWNTVLLDGSIPDEEVREMLIHSYDQVVAGLSKSVRSTLGTPDVARGKRR